MRRPVFQGGLFSCFRVVCGESLQASGQWFSGNHFWFRARVLGRCPLFQDIWLTEPDFQLNLVEAGFSGVACADAVAGHRVQMRLLEWSFALERAKKSEQAAWVRLRPYRSSVRQARLFHAHPWAARFYCLMKWLYWGAVYCCSFLVLSSDNRFVARFKALEGLSISFGYLRAAHGCKEYSLYPRLLKGH